MGTPGPQGSGHSLQQAQGQAHLGALSGPTGEGATRGLGWALFWGDTECTLILSKAVVNMPLTAGPEVGGDSLGAHPRTEDGGWVPT